MIVKLDANDAIAEGNENNNVVVSNPITMVAPISLSYQVAGHLGGASEAVAVSGNYAYELSSAALRVLDISNPAQNPQGDGVRSARLLLDRSRFRGRQSALRGRQPGAKNL